MPEKVSNRPQIYIYKINLKGFKSIQDLNIDFQKELNILIGKNGSGKSNFMELMDLVTQVNRYDEILCSYAKIEYLSNDNHSFTIELEKEENVRFSKNENYIDDRVGVFQRFIVDNEIVFDNRSNEERQNKNIFVFKGKKIIHRGVLRTLFSRMGYPYPYPLFIKFDLPDNLECISTPGTLKAGIFTDYYSWDYPKVLNFLQDIFWNIESYYDQEDVDDLNNPGKLKDISASQINEHLKINESIIDNLRTYTIINEVRFGKNISVYKDEQLVIIDNIKLEFKLNGNWLPWSQLSDGTKRLFYIISEVTHANGLILLEEPELGIHPHQFNLLMDFLKEQSKHKQIILSTHSPKALDHLNSDELNSIIIANYDLKKGTQIRHLSNKEIAKAKRYMKEVGFFSDYWMLSDLE